VAERVQLLRLKWEQGLPILIALKHFRCRGMPG
jgi:hypothetical protein